jgi:hypothetical protein
MQVRGIAMGIYGVYERQLQLFGISESSVPCHMTRAKLIRVLPNLMFAVFDV